MQFPALAALAGAAIATPIIERSPTHYGIATYYAQGGNAGSCGQVHSGSEYIVAISQRAPFTYNAHCGQTVTIKNTGGGDQNNGVGKTITAKVVDTCPSCDPDHLDLSTGAFKALTGGDLDPPGQINIQWHLN
ncbi:Putative RlpA-like domain superfamily protein [Septoria linicola]|uniref:RlpA-like domain superfamily protein n=1 Tax=Septoria linicola TaxID=215465 RepID=A0A9Q9B3Z8_9PEZI|nr:Putative RlpA-like domain superfamily protein [Septoria linicola]